MQNTWQELRARVDAIPSTFPFDFLIEITKDCAAIALWIGYLTIYYSGQLIGRLRGPVDPRAELRSLVRRRFARLDSDDETSDDETSDAESSSTSYEVDEDEDSN